LPKQINYLNIDHFNNILFLETLIIVFKMILVQLVINIYFNGLNLGELSVYLVKFLEEFTSIISIAQSLA
jgi:hypothetical protein